MARVGRAVRPEFRRLIVWHEPESLNCSDSINEAESANGPIKYFHRTSSSKIKPARRDRYLNRYRLPRPIRPISFKIYSNILPCPLRRASLRLNGGAGRARLEPSDEEAARGRRGGTGKGEKMWKKRPSDRTARCQQPRIRLSTVDRAHDRIDIVAQCPWRAPGARGCARVPRAPAPPVTYRDETAAVG